MTPKKKKQSLSGLDAAFVAVLVATIVAVILALSAVLTMVAWNIGVAAVVAASGGHVGHIGFWTAVGFNIAWGIITSPFRRPAPAKS